MFSSFNLVTIMIPLTIIEPTITGSCHHHMHGTLGAILRPFVLLQSPWHHDSTFDPMMGPIIVPRWWEGLYDCAKGPTYNGAKGYVVAKVHTCMGPIFFQWYYDGIEAACDGAMWLMMVTRVLQWSKVHNDSAKGPMMMTRPYNTLPTIIKTLRGTILGPCNNHRALNTIIGPHAPTPS